MKNLINKESDENISKKKSKVLPISYKKLWHLLVEHDMNKKDLLALTGASTSTIAKLTKCENINLDILVKICHVLDCNIGDIIDVLPKGDNAVSVERRETSRGKEN